MLHQELGLKYDLTDSKDPYSEYESPLVLENKSLKILWSKQSIG